MNTDYESLIRAFCDLVGLPDDPKLAAGASIEVSGIPMSLVHDSRTGHHQFFLHVDFGPLPSQRRLETLHQLMVHNFLTFEARGTGYGISPSTGHVVYAEAFTITDTTAGGLADQMATLAARAADWRQSRFLTGAFEAGAGGPHPVFDPQEHAR